MIPWFDPHSAHWFSFCSLLSLASVLQVFVDRGRHRALVTAVLAAGGVFGAALLLLTVVAALAAQPGYVLFALGLTGVVISAIFGTVLLTLRQQYTAAELRRMAAKEI